MSTSSNNFGIKTQNNVEEKHKLKSCLKKGTAYKVVLLRTEKEVKT